MLFPHPWRFSVLARRKLLRQIPRSNQARSDSQSHHRTVESQCGQ